MSTQGAFKTIAEYESFIFDLRHKKILEKMDARLAAMPPRTHGPSIPGLDLRCDCQICKELWKS